MAERRETYAYFWVADFDVPHDAITAAVGLSPSRAWNKGEPAPSGRPAKSSRWELHSVLPRDEIFVDKHIEALVPVLEPRARAIIDLGTRYECGISCVGKFYDANPGFHLSADLIARLAALKLPVDFDLYCYSED